VTTLDSLSPKLVLLKYLNIALAVLLSEGLPLAYKPTIHSPTDPPLRILYITLSIKDLQNIGIIKCFLLQSILKANPQTLLYR
jgi:hypothetical protein